MKTFLLFVCVFICRLSIAAEPGLFEVHAVSKTATESTALYSLPARDGHTEAILVQPEVLLDQSAVKSASVQKGPDGELQILITFNEMGAKKFAEITQKYLNDRIALFANGQLQSAPLIRNQITGGTAIISGNLNQAEADKLAARINRAVKW